MNHAKLKYLKFFFKDIHINKIVKVLTLSDLFIWSGFGLLNPIFAVFVTEQIKGGSIEAAGFAASIYFGSKSLLQIPIARYIDLKTGEKDDFKILLLGSVVVGLTPFLYIFAQLPWHLYVIQAIYGAGNALAFVSWDAIFTRHVDKDEVALEWSIYYTLVDLGVAAAAGAGGIIAQNLGFRPLFLLVGTITSAGALVYLTIARHFASVSSN